MLDPKRLLTFREVARQGSFSRAAEALSRSQPAVSHQVRALERELGARLLVRGRAGAVPTPAGELLLGHADALAAGLALADAQMASFAQPRTLRVGAVPSALGTVVPAALAAVRAEAVVREGTVEALRAGVESGELDVAVVFDAEAGGLERTHLATDPLLALLPTAHPLAGRGELDLAELAGEPWMVPAPDSLAVRACREAGFEPRVAITTRDPLAAYAIAAAGLAVSLVPRLQTRVPLPGVATVPLRGEPARRELYALAPARGAHPLAQRLIEALAAATRTRSPATP